MNLASLAGGVTVVKSKAFQWFLVVFLILLIAYLIYRQGQKSSGFQEAAKLPNSGSGIPQGWTPTKLADECWVKLNSFDIWEYFGGINSTFDDERIPLMKVLMNLSNDQITALYNDYNFRYGKKDGMTSLTKKIKSEYFLPSKDEVVIRLQNLNLN